MKLIKLSTIFFRQGFMFVTGILTYAVAWAVLGQSSQDDLKPGDWKYFTVRRKSYNVIAFTIIVICNSCSAGLVPLTSTQPYN